MQIIHAHAAFRHHIPRDGRIDPARYEQQPLPRRANGHSADALFIAAEHERKPVFADIDVYRSLRRMHVDVQRGILRQQTRAEFAADFGRSQRITFIAAVRFHLKRAALRTDELCRLEHRLHRAFRAVAERIRMNAEHARDTRGDFLGAAFFKLRHEISPVGAVQLVTDPAQTAFEIDRKNMLEVTAILPFEMNFRIADNNDLFHNLSLPFGGAFVHRPRANADLFFCRFG